MTLVIFIQLHLTSYKSGLLSITVSGVHHQPVSTDMTSSHVREKEGACEKTPEAHQYSDGKNKDTNVRLFQV